MVKYVQRGEVIEYKNDGTAAIAAGDVVSLGTRVGIAAGDIKAGDTGSLAVCGVFEFAKTSELAIAQGNAVYYNATTKAITKTNTDVPAGWAIAAAVAADATVLVKIG